MSWKFTVFLLVLAAFTASFAFAESSGGDYFGLKTIKEPYKSRIQRLILGYGRQSKAIDNSGYEIFYLDDIVEVDYDKIYVWENSYGNTFKTEHFLGTGVMFMREGEYYLAKKGVLWLEVLRNEDTIKFSVE